MRCVQAEHLLHLSQRRTYRLFSTIRTDPAVQSYDIVSMSFCCCQKRTRQLKLEALQYTSHLLVNYCMSLMQQLRFFLLIEFALLLCRGILILLVLRDQIVHVGLCLCELHLIHTLTYRKYLNIVSLANMFE